MNSYEYAYRTGSRLTWRKVSAVDEKEAIKVIRERHKVINSFFPYAGPLLIR